MSFIVLHADRLATVVADDPVVPASEVKRLNDALALFAAGERALADAASGAEATSDVAQGRGYNEGYAAGRAAADAELLDKLIALTQAGRKREDERRRDVARLAIEVVRRIAGEIGPEETVAALARQAALAVMPNAGATVRVAREVHGAVSARLSGLRGVTVEADASLEPTDCLIETALGTTRAGLETQLAGLERHWSEDLARR